MKDYQEHREWLSYLEWQLNKNESELVRWRVGPIEELGNENESRIVFLENKIAFIQQEISEMNRQIKEMKQILDSFSSLDNQILKLKYIEQLTLEEIARKIGYSAAYVRKKHAEIRSRFNFLEDYEKRKSRTSHVGDEGDFKQELFRNGADNL